MGALAVISLCIAGVLALTLAIRRYSRLAFSAVHYTYPRWGGVGALCIGVALLCAWREYGAPYGVLLWLGSALVALSLTAVVLRYRPRQAVWLVLYTSLLGAGLAFLPI